MRPSLRGNLSVLLFAASSILIGCGSDSSNDVSATPAGASGSGGVAAGAGGSMAGASATGGATAHGGAADGGAAGSAGKSAGGSSAGGSSAAGAGGAAGTTSTGGAGGTTGGAGGSADVTIAQACNDFWTKRCNEWEACYPADLGASFASVSACVSTHAARCEQNNADAASNTTGSDLGKCFDAYGTLECGAVYRFLHENAPQPAECTLPPGKLADGAACFTSSQCSSQFCVVDRTGCGVCGAVAPEGAACKAEADCAPGMGCRKQKCVAYVDKGGSCATNRCHADLACVGEVCSDAQKDGDICDPQNDSCGIESACNAITNHCSKLVVAKPGDPCGYLPSGETATCGGGSRCKTDGSLGTGTCVAAAKPGEACEFRTQCSELSSCQNGSCFLPSVSTCVGSGGAGGSGGSGGAMGGSGGSAGTGGSQGGSGGSGGLDHGAPSDVYPAPHPAPPVAIKGAAPAMSSPVIVPVFFPGDVAFTNLDKFVTKIIASTYFETTIGEYVTGAPTAMPSVTVTDMLPATITDADVQAFLVGKLDGTHPEFGVPDINHLYTLFFPPTVMVSDPGVGVACVDFGGYHGTVVLPDGTAAAYAVVPRCDKPGMGLFRTTEAASHEMVEAITDPRVYFPAWAGVDADHIAWASMGGGELGDLCEFEGSNNAMNAEIGFAVQSTWSNVSAAAGHNPCVPWAGVYFGGAPVLNDDVLVGGFFSQKTKGIRIPLKGSAVVEIDLFSDGPTNGPMTVAMKDGGALVNSPAQLSFSLDKNTGFNGEKVYATITVTGPGKSGGEPFIVETTVGGKGTQWFGLVVQ